MNRTIFDAATERRNTGSVKWDTEEPDILPMWVADMDFRTAPCIIEALRRRVDHGIFGYTHIPDEYYDAVIRWFSRRHGLDTLRREHILHTPGVVPAISATIKGLCAPGDGVIIQAPVYNCFFSSISNNGCRIVENPLIYSDATYSIDFDGLEKAAADPGNKLLLLCNPQNPGGRVWSRDELMRIAEICCRHGVTVVSDEIHCELTFDGIEYTPFGSLSPEIYAKSVTLSSPSKAFNTAGLQMANIFAPDEAMRSAIDRAININEVCDANPFGVAGVIAAYNEGEEWLEELKKYLRDNYLCLRNFFESELPGLTVTKLEGTYLVWVDCRATGKSSAEIKETLYEKGRVRVQEGSIYGKAGEGFIRINIACPRPMLFDGLCRIRKGFEALEQQSVNA